MTQQNTNTYGITRSSKATTSPEPKENEKKSTIDNTGGVIVVVITEHRMKVNKNKGLTRSHKSKNPTPIKEGIENIKGVNLVQLAP
jgi:hypothetical protein